MVNIMLLSGLDSKRFKNELMFGIIEKHMCERCKMMAKQEKISFMEFKKRFNSEEACR